MKKFFSAVFLIGILFAAFAAAQTTGDDKIKSPIAEKPIAYGLLIDNSGSQRSILEYIIESSKAIVEANNPDDETFVVRFVDNQKIKLIQDFTSSIDELDSALENLYIEGGQTAILDSVYFAAKHLAEKEDLSPDKQKVLILITDGDDRKSDTKIEILLKFLKNEKIKVFSLGLAEGKIYKNLLEKLAKETGGKSYVVEKRTELKNAVKELTTVARMP